MHSVCVHVCVYMLYTYTHTDRFQAFNPLSVMLSYSKFRVLYYRHVCSDVLKKKKISHLAVISGNK